ncbi:double-strand break repair protein AddB [Kaustia mangrovi]|uniref:Double-strand break repair protein AddB n=1 Tax=Kaustia mangrovi TaxID=2593653 RepID=A0A7S8C399_9HYPH|nr:double-strand break repair protein AddB [Kaustia mangrovi]QPC42558.1 double-strand break repair protein AddB [Kaustia mangrovi]
MAGGGQPPRVFTVPPGAPFLDRLAAAILAGDLPAPGGEPPDPLALPRYTVLVPTRRAARMLTERFLAHGDGDARLLPQIHPLGDVDEEELALSGEDMADEGGLDMAPAIAPLERELLLARLLLDWAAENPEHHLGRTLNAGPAQAISLARSLARLIDSLETEELPIDRLDALAGGDYPEHRKTVLDFLTLVRHTLPEALAARGLTGPAARRARLLSIEADRLARTPPDAPVIAAGSTGSIPATARLLSVIARLPRGAVVLPGLDRDLDEAGWAALAPQHPQFGLRQLLDGIGLDREAVMDLTPGPDAPRARLMSEVMRPSETTERWRHAMASLTGPELDAALDGLDAIEAPTPREEALAIALVMRRTLETPGRTAALVTPDRRLARRVAAELERWDVAVDDTAGTPLAQTPQGAFMLHVLDAWTSDFAPVALLALVKHPLAAFGLERAELRRRARGLEIALLRGLRPPAGLDGLAHALKARRRAAEEGKVRLHPAIRRLRPQDWDGLEDLMARLQSAFAALGEMPDGPSAIAAHVTAHVTVAEKAAHTPRDDAALWREEAGEALSGFLAGLIEASDAGPALDPRSYAGALRAMMAGRPVRARFGLHPRLAIYGLLEARLVAADVMILGGLNEAVWPSEPEDDPWLNRPMRAEIGLPLPERRIGLAAHDFVQAASAPRVHLTWSRKIDGAPAVPSRWVLRLKALLQTAGAEAALVPESPWLDRASMLDTPDTAMEIAPPRPAPPVEARPRQLSVTRIEEWIRDPYAIFARNILRLEPLDPIDALPGPAERGTLVHGALQRFAERHPERLPDDPVAELMAAGREVFGPWMDYPDVRGFWWPQYERMARWFAAEEETLRTGTARQWAELSGRLELDAPAGAFALTGRADRLDLLQDGTARLIDYKTGQPPSRAQVEAGLSPQLPLEARMVEAGAFEGVGPLPVGALAYIRLTGGEPAGRTVMLDGLDVPQVVEQTVEGLKRLIGHYDRPEQAYIPRAKVMLEDEERDYDHFSRFREWSATRARRDADNGGDAS